jgi:tRNA(Ser,Leu) C12 N-acetylase TAN1
MVVMLKGKGNEDLDIESLEIDEIENALENISSEVYIKESECINVILVELGTDSVEVARKLRESPTKIISMVVPINTVVKTNIESILSKVKELSVERINKNETFFVRCVVMNENRLTSFDIENTVIEELNKLELEYNEESPQWNIYVEIIGKNTGISVLKSCDFTEDINNNLLCI